MNNHSDKITVTIYQGSGTVLGALHGTTHFILTTIIWNTVVQDYWQMCLAGMSVLFILWLSLYPALFRGRKILASDLLGFCVSLSCYES